MPERRIEYVALDEVKGWEENPKSHNLGALVVSIRRWESFTGRKAERVG